MRAPIEALIRPYIQSNKSNFSALFGVFLANDDPLLPQSEMVAMYTESHRDALREAIASGVLRVSYDGRTVEYRSLTDLRAALREVEAALDPARRTVRQIRISADTGL